MKFSTTIIDQAIQGSFDYADEDTSLEYCVEKYTREVLGWTDDGAVSDLARQCRITFDERNFGR